MSCESPPSGLRLGGVTLLEGLAPERLHALARECAWRNYGRAQQILSRDAATTDVYLIVAGRVRATTFSSEGREVAFRELAAGDYFGEVSAIDGQPRSADVFALEDTLVASMPPCTFRSLLEHEPVVAERVLRRLAHLVRDLSERVIHMSTLSVAERVCAELLRLAGDSGFTGNVARLKPGPRHADIASRVGTYREQVTRELSALVRAGVLEREPDALVIRDVGMLARLAAQNRAAP
jgi:CRP/FNR family transcriptional regulator, cyclic AMP receptor protein